MTIKDVTIRAVRPVWYFVPIALALLIIGYQNEILAWVASDTAASTVVQTVGHEGHPDLKPQNPEDTPEEGKPPSCDNYRSTAPAHRCSCGKAMHDKCDEPDPDVEMDKKCRTYCRKQNCKCLSACTT